jgi:fatty acid desaturase
MMDLKFTPRSELSNFEWDFQRMNWDRLDLDRKILKELSKRSTCNGLCRIGLYISFLVASAASAIYISRHNFWLAIPMIYIYYFFFGFSAAIGHEMQHKTVFSKNYNWLNNIMLFLIQTLNWNSPRYARISHRLHHRYTMVRGIDPETPWPDVITSKWLKKFFWGLVLKILVVGAVADWFIHVKIQIQRVLGIKDKMMRDHCSDKDVLVIRLESLAILLIHASIISLSIISRRWEPIIFITIAFQIGAPMENFWHHTEHIARLYNVKDQRLCTRSVRVNPLVKLIYWGLDDHIDHHLFPAVPSRNLPKLHQTLKKDLPEPQSMIQCWLEMFAVAREKDCHPDHEYVPLWQ